MPRTNILRTGLLVCDSIDEALENMPPEKKEVYRKHRLAGLFSDIVELIMETKDHTLIVKCIRFFNDCAKLECRPIDEIFDFYFKENVNGKSDIPR